MGTSCFTLGESAPGSAIPILFVPNLSKAESSRYASDDRQTIARHNLTTGLMGATVSQYSYAPSDLLV